MLWVGHQDEEGASTPALALGSGRPLWAWHNLHCSLVGALAPALGIPVSDLTCSGAVGSAPLVKLDLFMLSASQLCSIPSPRPSQSAFSAKASLGCRAGLPWDPRARTKTPQSRWFLFCSGAVFAPLVPGLVTAWSPDPGLPPPLPASYIRASPCPSALFSPSPPPPPPPVPGNHKPR